MLALFLVTGILVADGTPSPAKLRQDLLLKCKETKEQLAKHGGSWTVEFDFGADSRAEVSVEVFPKSSRYEFLVVLGGLARERLSITCEEDVWLVKEGTRTRRYRPYEATFDVPIIVHLMKNAQPSFADEVIRDREMFMKIEEAATGRMIVWRRPTRDEGMRLKGAWLQYERNAEARKIAGAAASTEERQYANQVRELGRVAYPLTVDPATGMFLDLGIPERFIHFHDFQLKKDGEAPTWSINPNEGEDHSTPYTVEQTADLVQIGWNGTYGDAPGLPMDLVLLNVQSGETRRVPFASGLATSGTFSPDRKKIYLPGRDTNGAITIHEVDLSTGQARRLGDEGMESGTFTKPVVSPDGKRLATVSILPGEVYGDRACIVDLATSATRRINNYRDVRLIDWHPDGKSLLVEYPEFQPRAKSAKIYMGIMNMRGEIQKVRWGQEVSYLPKAERFLFVDEVDGVRKWHTCRLTGEDVQVCGDGLVGCHSPAPSADGRLLMISAVGGDVPKPSVIDTATFAKTPIEVPAGAWGRPSWK